MSPILTQISVLFLALVVLSVFSVSLPYLPALYTLHFGIWGFYSEFTNGTSACTKAGAAYALTFSSGGTAVTIASNWTRGLVLYPVGKGRFHTAGVTFVALLVTCCGTAPAGAVSGLALLLTFIALWPHVALDQYIWHKMKGTGADTKLGNALALHFLSATLLMIASAGAIRGTRGPPHLHVVHSAGGKRGTNKIMWSSEHQRNSGRRFADSDDLSEERCAVEMAKNMLFGNANRVYVLHLQPTLAR
ncbi:hypothetical protein FIBSPDRAFT_1038447 [Athelia psychrophila]|uniref:Uncharacterized protein n=1 Tax=Athelia psychrophila TaxID=1759441 RepID=A0A166T206_9AGAM|nr:hypothetical protein FIBSPDRAFT_1038447 [Fibularhizoctonia sp. CBS 109695]